MTIATFCQEQLLTFGPLDIDDLAARAVDAGMTRARNPQASLLSVIRSSEIQLVDGRWVTPLWLLEGRCLTASDLPYGRGRYGDIDPDLDLLGSALPTRAARSLEVLDDPTRTYCVRVNNGAVSVSVIAAPDAGTPEVRALAQLVAARTLKPGYGDNSRLALRAVAQLMVDDPSTFRTPLPPLTAWVPLLVEEARHRAEQEQRMLEWQQEEEFLRRGQVVLDDCTAIEVELAAERAGLPVQAWVSAAIDRALQGQRRPEPGGVVIALGDRWR